MKNRLSLLVVLLLTLVSCTRDRRSPGDPAQIVEIPEAVQTSFYDRVSEFGLLPLETVEGSELSDILKIRVYQGRIYLLSGLSNTKLLAFTKEGKFVTEVGRRGRGPQEYVELSNFEIDPIRNELILLDRNGLKLLICDLEGNFKQQVKIPSAPECAGRLPNGNFVLAYVRSRFNDGRFVAICDENGNLLEQHVDQAVNSSMKISAKDMMIAQNDGSLSLIPQYQTTLYRITDDGITAETGFAIPGESITTKELDREFDSSNDFIEALKSKNYLPGNHAESDRYIFFYNKGLEEMEHVFYDKTGGESLRVRHPLFGTSVFMDERGYCWAAVDQTRLTSLEKGNDELTRIFMKAFDNYGNVPLIYYKVKI